MCQIFKVQGGHSPGKVREVQSGREKVREMKKVREKSGETEISVMTKDDHETLFGHSRMQENLLAAGVLPRTLLGELTALPQIP